MVVVTCAQSVKTSRFHKQGTQDMQMLGLCITVCVITPRPFTLCNVTIPLSLAGAVQSHELLCTARKGLMAKDLHGQQEEVLQSILIPQHVKPM